ncbi:MAG: UDP-N-acetylmuramoyl-L-alanine--D-glutamate ligase [Candidatus Brennerbacteria bacterium]|nr:UDP-N-acetylmuramoyl-L-alanine--D-glutamate ligase [Candidatus Brennerbacteria bacterium]
MGLGLLGGGVATAKWLVKDGAKVTVTDLKTRRELGPSVRSLGPVAKSVRFVLGRHLAPDFRKNEIVVVNPGVPRESKYLKIAQTHGAKLENEASIFFRACRNPVVAVTGTRGKTTTATWIHHLLKKKYPKTVLTGNSSDNPMLAALVKLDGRSPVVVELSSWHLELLPKSGKAPHVAVITNLYPDHLNRYPSMRSYALAKANVFSNQSDDDFLLLNKTSPWTKFFRGRKPRSRVVYFPADVGFDLEKFKKTHGFHNFYNLNVAALVARHFGVPLTRVKSALKTLPQVRFREETIIKRRNIEVVNDTTATTPEATIAALKRFGSSGRLILITGGTDKKLNFKEWARDVKKYVKPENLFLLNSTATKKMVRELKIIGYFRKSKPQIFETLPLILHSVKKKLNAKRSTLKPVVLFSPGATSFEKFKNEFDRGEQFNRLAKKYFSRI